MYNAEYMCLFVKQASMVTKITNYFSMYKRKVLTIPFIPKRRILYHLENSKL